LLCMSALFCRPVLCMPALLKSVLLCMPELLCKAALLSKLNFVLVGF
jgi:uncharacterized membrane protein